MSKTKNICWMAIYTNFPDTVTTANTRDGLLATVKDTMVSDEEDNALIISYDMHTGEQLTSEVVSKKIEFTSEEKVFK